MDSINFTLSFSALAAHYKDFHLSGFDDEYLDLSTERLSPTAKRIAEGWLTYSLVELKQRYNIPGSFFFFKFILWLKFSTSGPLLPCIDESLNFYNDSIKTEFSKRWSKHKCSVPGCSTVLIFDGGCKVRQH